MGSVCYNIAFTMTSSFFLPPSHDHQHCIATALQTAASLCHHHGLRLTDMHRLVLERIWRRHVPVGAYNLLDSLRAEGHNVHPPTIYRALEFLLRHGLIHRISHMKAYIGCTRPGHAHHFLICRSCHVVAEIDDPALDTAIAQVTAGAGFTTEGETMLEIAGLCAHCWKDA